MSKCDNCGRGDGHWLGCAKAQTAERKATPLAPEDADQCVFPGCTDDKRPAGKGPKPKFCTKHSDPKNRK